MKCLIMRGLPGSGKSTHAERWAKEHDAVICSADHFFMVDGQYRFDLGKIGVAHASCQAQFAYALTDRRNVVVDNTNSRLWEYAPYVASAREAGYEVEVHEIVCPDTWTAEQFGRRCRHGVSVEKVLRMRERWEDDPESFTYGPEGI